MFKIAVLGHRDTVMGFKALGLEVYPAESGEEAAKLFKKLAAPEAENAVVYVEESFAEAVKHDMEKVKDMVTPAVILIPGRDGSLGIGQRALDEAVERAVGSAIK